MLHVNHSLAGLVLAQGAAGRGLDVLNLIPFLAIGVFFYFLLIRPERKKRAELSQMLEQLKKNDRVITIGGIIGTVVGINKDEVTIRSEEKSDTRLRMQRSAIRLVNPDEITGDKKDAG